MKPQNKVSVGKMGVGGRPTWGGSSPWPRAHGLFVPTAKTYQSCGVLSNMSTT